MENVSVRGTTLLSRPQPVVLPGRLWYVSAGLLEVIQVADIQYFGNRVLEHNIWTNYSTSKWFEIRAPMNSSIYYTNLLA